MARLLARWHVKLKYWHTFATFLRWHVWQTWHTIKQTLEKLNKVGGIFIKIKYFQSELDKVSRKLKTNLKIL